MANEKKKTEVVTEVQNGNLVMVREPIIGKDGMITSEVKYE